MKKTKLILALCLGYISCNQPSQNFVQLASGYELYQKNCANCHGDDGTGLGKLIPPLKNSDYILNNQKQLFTIIKEGLSIPIVVNGTAYSNAMPANTKITQSEAEAIIQFVLIKFNQQVK